MESNKDKYAFLRETILSERVGKRRIGSLFWEKRYENFEFEPLFTFKDDDHIVDDKVYYSLKKIYLSYDHVPGYEYEFALDVFGSWEHWQQLLNSQYKDEFRKWQEELLVSIKSKAIKNIIKISSQDSTSASLANKYLADKGWEKKAGRPSKEEVEREKKQAAGVSRDLADDMKRLGLSVVGGEK